MMRHIGWVVVGIIIIVLSALYIDIPNTNSFLGKSVGITKGIDLAGGARVLLCTAKNTTPSNDDMNTARDVINQRAAGGFGVTEPAVSRVGNNCISAEMPGLKNQSDILHTLGRTGALVLTDGGSTAIAQQAKVKLVCPPGQPDCIPGLKTTGLTNLSTSPPTMQVIVAGKYVQRGSAQVAFDQTGGTVVNYTLTGKGSDDWCTFTTSHVQKFSAIVLDGKVVSDPTIQQAICGGQTQITGVNSTDAKNISTFLNYGALPVALHIDSYSQVSASLGSQYVDEATKAGIVGLIIVALFMLLYYRLPGLLADIALLMYAAFVFAAFKLLGVTLTLAGIAGFILSIGMAVDANVLIFERLKEELRNGKTLGAAVESGFKRAFPSIRDSNASTIITTVILFWFGHSFAATAITGFATTLFLGVVISLLTAVFVSHTFLRLLVMSGYGRDPRYYGVEETTAA